jgi:hypothetical protein
MSTLRPVIHRKSLTKLNAALLICTAVGLVLMVITLVMNRSLWLDEAMLVLSIRERSAFALLEPLDDHQMAPIGWLLLQKLLFETFTQTDWSFRLLSLAAAAGSILLWRPVFTAVSRSEITSRIATAAFALNYFVLFYSNEAKPYATDMASVSIILFFTLRWYESDNRRSLVCLGIAGILLPWFSFAAPFALAGSGMFLVMQRRYQRRWKLLFYIALSWMFSFVMYYFLFLAGHPAQAYMSEYWQSGFMPLNPFTPAFIQFWAELFRMFSGTMIPFGPAWPLAALFLAAGVVYMIRRIHFRFTALLFPVVVHLVVSAFHRYPFQHRLVLYAVPVLTLVFVFGVRQLWSMAPRVVRLPQLLILPVFLFFGPLAAKWPLSREEIRPAVAALASSIKPGHSVYVYYGAVPSFRFYAQKHPEFEQVKLYAGTESRENPEAYYGVIPSLPDTTWLIFSHVHPLNSPDNNERTAFLGRLTSAAFEISSTQTFDHVWMYRAIRRTQHQL